LVVGPILSHLITSEQIGIAIRRHAVWRYKQMSKTERCPDCDQTDVGKSFFHPHSVGNGACDECHGSGELRTVIDDIADGLGRPQDYEEGYDDCWKCNGTRKCQTCGGHGAVACEDEDAESEHNGELDSEKSAVDVIDHGDNISGEHETPESTEEEADEEDDRDQSEWVEHDTITTQTSTPRRSESTTDHTADPDLRQIVNEAFNSKAGKIGVSVAALVLAEHLTSSDGKPGIVTRGLDDFEHAMRNYLRLMVKVFLAVVAIFAIALLIAFLVHVL
jgi:hypothetical protein